MAKNSSSRARRGLRFGRRKRAPEGAGTHGPVRLADSSTAAYSAFRAGDIVVVSAADLSPDVAAELIERQIAGLVNVLPTFSGHFPTKGPEMLLEAGVHIIDDVGSGILDLVRNGERLSLVDAEVRRDDELIATGVQLTPERLQALLADSASGLTTRLDTIAVNATEYLRRERSMLLEGTKIPALTLEISGRPVVVVHDAHDAHADLKGIKRFVQDNDPVMVGVGSGTDIIAKLGFKPDITIGRPDEFSSAAVAQSREIVVVAPDGRIPTPERFEKGGSKPRVFASTAPPAELAILLADANEAAVIIHVGAAPDLSTFLDRDPAEVGSDLITRLHSGARLVDAKAVRFFVVQRIGWFMPLFFLVCATVALLVAVSVTPVGEQWADGFTDAFASFVDWLKGLFS